MGASPLPSLKATLGWGEEFRHYPAVYRALAHPYQFDDSYEIIPGMYQLYHNPAAGLISSVNDLARFDVALDLNLLLSEESRAQMFTPAFSTYSPSPLGAWGMAT